MGSTFHSSNRSGETLTRLTAAQGLCSMEQIELIVFFLFQTGGPWGGGGSTWGQGAGVWILDGMVKKNKGMHQKTPTPGLER